jgi:hypothetical protein
MERERSVSVGLDAGLLVQEVTADLVLDDLELLRVDHDHRPEMLHLGLRKLILGKVMV